ncbi:5-(carboxyamino)imidazole ribonucleotide synthase [Prochlorococcus marinus]|uniref:N5-carboxyaminoimidazole ribonucleotide synthase n=1 Tax=Prochlorococcus marinus XMU1408 TaxID=2213228 RepID=A0A318R0M6_PROMR|nr:5-(carboxyamino)imidazole ribonucleotide synthase [Prochlorococcus marinus]MBW3041709.1 5-(carboxyamino)imidazole ribonucleotide synthase [Prochlorococcus marinus str. XMU1408]PYE02856.1 5-(carboxyamino)imidazole ribonucleotide synthase [Prochlorococcus marinus XMU1408]
MIGVVGGGQLAMLLVEAGKKRDVDVVVQTGVITDPAAKKTNQVILHDPTNANGTKLLAEKSRFITFENEWVDIPSLISLQNNGVSFVPRLQSIRPLLNKISQRELLNSLDIPCPDWFPIPLKNTSGIELPADWRFPLMAKASKGGYDGKGTKIIKNLKQLRELLEFETEEQWMLEKWVSFEKELSIVSSRDSKGIVRSLPIVETFQSKQVCDWVLAPADINHDVDLMVKNIVSSLLTELDYVGVIAIEFFYGSEGLLVNEIAPRTHNSGHFSIDACSSSQFDQQICITSGINVPMPEMFVDGALMANLLGLQNDYPISITQRLNDLRGIPGLNVHWYEKEEEKKGRKLGHVTYLLNEKDPLSRKKEALDVLKAIRSIWPTS